MRQILHPSSLILLATTGDLAGILQHRGRQSLVLESSLAYVDHLPEHHQGSFIKQQVQTCLEKGICQREIYIPGEESEDFLDARSNVHLLSAELIALSLQRSAELIVDSTKVLQYVHRQHPGLKWHTTLELIQAWFKDQKIPLQAQMEWASEKASAYFAITKSHPQLSWWEMLVTPLINNSSSSGV